MNLRKEGYYSDYYERLFSLPEMQQALVLYLRWNAANGYTPEMSSTNILDWYETQVLAFDTLLYHAEIQQQNEQQMHTDYSVDVVIAKK